MSGMIPDREGVRSRCQTALVRIEVTGRNVAGQVAQPRIGIGVVIGANGLIVTAGHVIGKDEEWAETGGRVRERTVKVTGLDDHRLERPFGTAQAWHVPGYDVALLTVNAQGMKTVPLADQVPQKNESLVALLWGPTGVPQAITANLLETDQSQHGNVLTVHLTVVEGNSGSGLFDAEFRLTGIILNRIDDQRALAIPIAFIRPLLPVPSAAQVVSHMPTAEACEDLLEKGLRLGKDRHREEAIAVYDNLLARFGENPKLEVRRLVAIALLNKGLQLGKLRHRKEAIAAYDALLPKFGEDSDALIREQVGDALLNKGFLLAAIGNNKDAAKTYDDLLTRLRGDTNLPLSRQIAVALFNKALQLVKLGRNKEAVAVCDKLLSRFASTSDALIREQLADARSLRDSLRRSKMSEGASNDQSGGINNSGTMNTGGGDIVGRDKIVGAPPAAALDSAFCPLTVAVKSAPNEVRTEAETKLDTLKTEAAKGDDANDEDVANLVDGLVGLVPEAASAAVSAFAGPILVGITGPVTKFVLRKLRSQ